MGVMSLMRIVIIIRIWNDIFITLNILIKCKNNVVFNGMTQLIIIIC